LRRQSKYLRRNNHKLNYKQYRLQFGRHATPCFLQDYLFVYSNAVPAEDARKVARTYFSQGHEINFVQVKEWILNNLVTLGSKCRAVFTKELLALLDVREVPASVKIAWNDLVKKVVAA
jgi:hypothetical protein